MDAQVTQVKTPDAMGPSAAASCQKSWLIQPFGGKSCLIVLGLTDLQRAAITVQANAAAEQAQLASARAQLEAGLTKARAQIAAARDSLQGVRHVAHVYLCQYSMRPCRCVRR